MLKLVLFACACALALASDGGVVGNLPTSAQTGQLHDNQKFLFGPTDTKCSKHYICKSCVEDVTCGWCATSGLCYDGNVLGPMVANCSMWEFAWCSGEPCVEHATCKACITDPLCGLCQHTNTCTEGSAQGPMFGDCQEGSWFGGASTPTRAPKDLPRAPCSGTARRGLGSVVPAHQHVHRRICPGPHVRGLPGGVLVRWCQHTN